MRVRKTDRYRLAEALAGAPGLDHGWRLPWHAQHLLCSTANRTWGATTPHYALWRLLDSRVLSTAEAFKAYPPEHRSCHFIRRTKEEMVKLDGKPLYPTRICWLIKDLQIHGTSKFKKTPLHRLDLVVDSE